MLKRIAFMAFLAVPIWAAGTVVQVGPVKLNPNGSNANLVGNTYKLTLTITADASDGSVPSTVLNAGVQDLVNNDGLAIVSMQSDPGSPAPTDNYDIVINNSLGLDVLGGTGANRDTSTTENAVPTAPLPISGALTFALTNNSVNSAVITIVITMTNSTVAKNGGSSSGSYAPNDATYLLQTANASLANAQAMGALATGLVKNTTTTGVQSIAVAGTDFISPTPLTGSTQLLYDSAAGTVALSPLFREDANTVAQRNGTTAQLMNVYATYTSAAVNSGIQFRPGTNTHSLNTFNNGAGTDANLGLGHGGTIQWFVNATGGHFQPISGNTYDFGASGAGSLVRSIYYGTTLTATQGTLSGSSIPAYTHTATWSNVATTFVDDFRNITDTNSAAGSLLAQWQVGGSDKFSITKAGLVTIAAGLVSSGQINGTNFYATNNTNTVKLAMNSSTSFGQIQTQANDVFGLGYGGSQTTNGTTMLVWNKTNNVGIGAGNTSPTGTFEVYDATASTGVTRSWIRAGAGQSTSELFGAYANDGTTPVFTVQNSNVTIYGLTQFGGTTSSFPALKRSTTDLQARLADDSGFTSFQGQYKSTDGTAGATTTCTIAGLISITVKNGLVTGCS